MYCAYQDREELEDDLYQEDEADSEGSEANSELEFRLYSQLHYSSNPGVLEELEDGKEKEHDRESQHSQQQTAAEKSADGDEELEHTRGNQSLSPTTGKLKKKKKKKKEEEEGQKRDKQKKRKIDPKSQKLPSSLFEEVIVIDSSSPNIIFISDDDSGSDDEGICALKGQGFNRLRASTPAHQEPRKMKSLDVPVIVNSSSSQSDSEESECKSESASSDSSDSDSLENWMILGRGKQEGDQGISLNVKGELDSHTGKRGDNRPSAAAHPGRRGGRKRERDAKRGEECWLVSDKDKEAHIYNKDRGPRTAVQRVSNRYYTNKNVHCRNCNKIGHLSKTCPEPTKLPPCFLCGTPGHQSIECPNKHCNNCGLPGHLYMSCSESSYWNKRCCRCNMMGHLFDTCPEVWRQYHITTKRGPPAKKKKKDNGRSPAYCYNCSRKGHFGHACTRQRMFNGVHPNTPFINCYDNLDDINRRQHRVKLKVKELKNNGCFTAFSQTPVTPGPPKKKQKTSYRTHNHQSNHTPHQTFSNHKPSHSHIFFNDSNDLSVVPPKKNKHNKSKRQESVGSAKPWKPKRPVPTSRDPPPRLILDEDDDFPRGGGTGESMAKKKRRKKNKMKHVPFAPPEGPGRLWTVRGKKQGPESQQEKGEKKRKRKYQAHRKSDKKLSAQMYPTDENLFVIKQRKHKR
ncbi:zinc finger CCHC domain-containing protein 7 isoform X1 [Brachyistius frenatus]|uniref:zinc finger CCHC domain-containing protein 7 isoform X1 n=1 Tax=Brachyistius frenatus TaxID=100188 RepID=UPI0037E8A404